MKWNIVWVGWAMAILGLAVAAFAELKIVIDHNNNAAATRDFKFKTVPAPVKDDAATTAKFTFVDGEMDPNGADLSALTESRIIE